MSEYELRYLPIFWEDLLEAVSYIKNVLGNEIAAKNLLDRVEEEVLKHLESPTTELLYQSSRERSDSYYWFSVGNYMVFYVVIDNVMEVRRFIYGARDLIKIDL